MNFLKKSSKLLSQLFIVLSAVTASIASEHPNLVLLPIEVDESDAMLVDEFGSALQQGLQNRFTVFHGVAVEKQLELEWSKLDCSSEECSQNIAISS